MSITGRVVQLIIGIALTWYGLTLVTSDTSDLFSWLPVVGGMGTILSALFPEMIDISTDGGGDSSFDNDSGGDGD